MGRKKGKRKGSDLRLEVVEPATLAQRGISFSSDGVMDLRPATLANVNEQTTLGIDAVYGCVQIIADAIAGARVGEWRGEEELVPSRLTLRPMATLTRREWLWQITSTLALYNHAYVLALGGKDSEGVPFSLRPLAPPQVTSTGRELLVDGRPIEPGTLYRWQRAVWPTVSPAIGALLNIARETFAAAMSADTYRSDFWQEGGAPAIVLTTDQEISDTQADALAARWVAKRTESPGKPAVLGKGASAKELGADLGTEGANIASDKLRASIARYFGMPPDMINAPSEAGPLTYSTSESHGLRLVRFTLGAYAETIGDGLSDLLPGDPILGRSVRLSLRHLTQAEQLSRFQAWEIALRAGWMTKAEVRKEEGLPPDAGLDAAGTPAPAIETIPVQNGATNGP